MHTPLAITKTLFRSMLVVLMLAAPVLAVPASQSFGENIIEAPAPKAKGIGFALLVILQRT
ncbi:MULTISPECIES: hypothetical protein [Mesorhizobium]|uniref:Uncharacterized protein n=1 Tax=Mesorhizobium denitrificans TaxID=2294114 RepID=A0A371XHM3_9HYPH|nr:MULTISPECIES: hypothetical protein [Mesorhizobium]RFC68729.1 hypothetical protein DY251_03565 [Mesorhizobium denitrificans]